MEEGCGRSAWDGYTVCYLGSRLCTTFCRLVQPGKRYHIHAFAFSSGLEVTVPPPVSPGVPDAYDVDLDAEGENDLLDILPFGKIDVFSGFRTDFTVICDKGVKFYVEAPTKLLVSSS